MKLLTPAKKQAQGKTRRLQCQMVKRRTAMVVREETAEHRLQSLTVKRRTVTERRTAMAVREETAKRRLRCRTVRLLTAAAALVIWVAVPADRRVSPTRRQTK